MKKQKVEKLIAKAVAKAEKRVEYELELVGERQHAQSMSLRALEQAFKEQQEAAQQKEQPRVPLNPSDWYPKPTAVRPISPDMKLVQFLQVGMRSPRYFYLTAMQIKRLLDLGVQLNYHPQQRDREGQFDVQLLPTHTRINVSELVKKVNEVLHPEYRVYAEVKVLD